VETRGRQYRAEGYDGLLQHFIFEPVTELQRTVFEEHFNEQDRQLIRQHENQLYAKDIENDYVEYQKDKEKRTGANGTKCSMSATTLKTRTRERRNQRNRTARIRFWRRCTKVNQEVVSAEANTDGSYVAPYLSKNLVLSEKIDDISTISEKEAILMQITANTLRSYRSINFIKKNMNRDDFTREHGPRAYDDIQSRLKRGTVFRYNKDSFNTIHVNMLTHVEEDADPIHEFEREDDMSHDEKTEEERNKLEEDEEQTRDQGSSTQDSSSSSSSSSNQHVTETTEERVEVEAEPKSEGIHVAQGGDQTHEPKTTPQEVPPKTPQEVPPKTPQEVPPKTPPVSPVQEQEQAEVTSSQESIMTMETLSALAETPPETGNETQEEAPQAESETHATHEDAEVESQAGNGTPTALESLIVNTKLPRARVYNAAAIDTALKHMTESENIKTNRVKDDSPTSQVDYSEETPKTDETPVIREVEPPANHTAEAEQIILDANMAQEMARRPDVKSSQLEWSKVVAKVREQKGEGSGKGEGSSKGSDNGTKPAASNSSVKSNTTKTNEVANSSRRISQNRQRSQSGQSSGSDSEEDKRRERSREGDYCERLRRSSSTDSEEERKARTRRDKSEERKRRDRSEERRQSKDPFDTYRLCNGNISRYTKEERDAYHKKKADEFRAAEAHRSRVANNVSSNNDTESEPNATGKKRDRSNEKSNYSQNNGRNDQYRGRSPARDYSDSRRYPPYKSSRDNSRERHPGNRSSRDNSRDRQGQRRDDSYAGGAREACCLYHKTTLFRYMKIICTATSCATVVYPSC
jgi:hypothetical protein